MALATRKATGVIPYPCTLLAGKQGAGKTWTSIAASASDKVDRTFVLTLGEILPDGYGHIPGADFEIVEHDGTYEGILGAVLDIRAEPRGDRPHLTVLDTGNALWELIVANKQAIANSRGRAEASASRLPAPKKDTPIHSDLWTEARDEWYRVLNLLRTMPGPTVITARMEERTVTEGGKPTTDKVWRIRGEGNLPYDVTAVVEMTERGQYVLTKANSPLIRLEGRRAWEGFTLDALWDEMGLATHSSAPAEYADAKLTNHSAA